MFAADPDSTSSSRPPGLSLSTTEVGGISPRTPFLMSGQAGMSTQKHAPSTTGICHYCGTAITLAADGAWEDERGACGCGSDEHEPAAQSMRKAPGSTPPADEVVGAHDITAREVASWESESEAIEEDSICMGHPSDEFHPMGEPVFCDGSCRVKPQRGSEPAPHDDSHGRG